MKTTKPTICHVVLSLGVGGTERLVCAMCRYLRRNFQVLVCCLDEPGIWGRELRKEGIPVYALYRSPGIDLSVIFALDQILKDHEVDLIHAHQYSPFFYAALSRLFFPKARLLFMEHGRHWPETKKPLKNIFNRLFLQPLTQEIVAVSKEVRERLRVYEGLSKGRIRVIYNGINPPLRISAEERTALRRYWGIDHSTFVAVTVGRLDPIKNIPLFLKALVLVRQKIPIRALIIGDGPERNYLERLAVHLGLEKAVTFTGYRKDATRLMQIGDVFVLSSFSEGTSLALLEAMACGLPSVVTEVGGNPEVVADGQTGFVVASEDPVQMAAALYVLAENPFLAQKMGEAARHRFEQKFTFEKMMQAYQELYYQMLGQSPCVCLRLEDQQCVV